MKNHTVKNYNSVMAILVIVKEAAEKKIVKLNKYILAGKKVQQCEDQKSRLVEVIEFNGSDNPLVIENIAGLVIKVNATVNDSGAIITPMCISFAIRCEGSSINNDGVNGFLNKESKVPSESIGKEVFVKPMPENNGVKWFELSGVDYGTDYSFENEVVGVTQDNRILDCDGIPSYIDDKFTVAAKNVLGL